MKRNFENKYHCLKGLYNIEPLNHAAKTHGNIVHRFLILLLFASTSLSIINAQDNLNSFGNNEFVQISSYTTVNNTGKSVQRLVFADDNIGNKIQNMIIPDSASTPSIRERYNRIYIGYAPVIFKSDYGKTKAKGFDIGYAIGRRLAASNLYGEIGYNIQYVTHSSTENASASSSVVSITLNHTSKYKFLRMNVPVTAAYRVYLNENLYIAPYLGLNITINAMAKWTWSNEGKGINNNSGEENLKFKPFQMGFHTGGYIGFGRKRELTLGIGYERQFTNAKTENRTKSGGMTLNFGLNF